MNEQQFIDEAKYLLEKAGISCDTAIPEIVAPDGSNRKFWRLAGAIAVAPETADTLDMAEAQATWQIGRHLFSRGCAVPEIYGFDEKSGLLVMEDLGDTSLYSKVQQLKEKKDKGEVWEEIAELYFQVLDALVKLQLLGREDFQSQWCWTFSHYNKEVMLTKESGYFLSAWWQNFLQQDVPDGIIEEFAELAERAEEAERAGQADFFLHRDCQSRNIFFEKNDGKPKFIDFQSGQKGPLGYDLASLLMDPYVGLPQELQHRLFSRYVELLQENGVQVAEKEFRYWYEDIALHRNLQIIGAFSFLSQVRGKMFFAQFIEPSVKMLRQRLTAPQFSQFSVLRKMAAQNL